MMPATKQTKVRANGIDFVAVEQGEGPLVLCLHGFPDHPLSFRHQMAALAAAGYRAVAPSMRGYSPTGPAPDGLYQTAVLGRDVLALIDALGAEQAILFGHDWGALAAYTAAAKDPSRISKLIAAAVPYGPRFATAFLSDYEQLKRSWYVYFFQSPIAESVVGANDCEFIRGLWKDWSPTWSGAAEECEPVCKMLGDPAVLTAALGPYRAMFDPARQDPALADEQAMGLLTPIQVPTLYIHGIDDGCMGVELAEGMEEAFTGEFTKLLVPGAGHFVLLEKPDEVNRAVLDFLRGS